VTTRIRPCPNSGVRREQRADFPQQPASQDFAFDGQAAALVIVEQDPFLAEFFLEDLVFGAEVFDELLLLVVDPAGENGNQKLPRAAGRNS
jgi:hypothetical protein